MQILDEIFSFILKYLHFKFDYIKIINMKKVNLRYIAINSHTRCGELLYHVLSRDKYFMAQKFDGQNFSMGKILMN